MPCFAFIFPTAAAAAETPFKPTFLPPCRFSVITGVNPLTVNEAVLRGLDYVVDQARQHGIRVILTLTDYFRDDAGGPLQYLL